MGTTIRPPRVVPGPGTGRALQLLERIAANSDEGLDRIAKLEERIEKIETNGHDPRNLLTRKEAAVRLSVSPDHFDRHIRPALPCIRKGRKVLWRIDALDRWEQEQEEPAPAETLPRSSPIDGSSWRPPNLDATKVGD